MKYLFIGLISAVLLTTTAQAFSGFEHLYLGGTVYYPFPKDSTSFGNQTMIDYPYKEEINKIRSRITYTPKIFEQYLMVKRADIDTVMKLNPGEIVALSGDYIADPHSPGA